MTAANRIWVIAGSLIIVVVLALAGLLGVLPQLDAARSSDEQTAGVESVNEGHRAALVTLEDDSTRLAEIAAEVSELRKSVPASTDLDSVVAELAALQGATGVTIQSYSSAPPSVFVPAAGIVAQVPPSINSTNFLTTEIQLEVDGPRAQAIELIRGLQSDARLFFVKGISGSAPEKTSITLLVYTLLDTPLVDPAAAVAPVPAPEADAAE